MIEKNRFTYIIENIGNFFRQNLWFRGSLNSPGFHTGKKGVTVELQKIMQLAKISQQLETMITNVKQSFVTIVRPDS